jgi:hypothetical protein
MLRRISVFLLAVLLVLSLAGNVAMAQTPPNRDTCDVDPNQLQCDKGQPGADETKETGSPDDPNSWGAVASQLGDAGVMGKHSSDPVPGREGHETPRDGLGNVAKNDSEDHGVTGTCSEGEFPETDNCDSGDNLSDHGCVAAAAPLPGIPEEDQPELDCTAEPGGNRGPGSE